MHGDMKARSMHVRTANVSPPPPSPSLSFSPCKTTRPLIISLAPDWRDVVFSHSFLAHPPAIQRMKGGNTRVIIIIIIVIIVIIIIFFLLSAGFSHLRQRRARGGVSLPGKQPRGHAARKNYSHVWLELGSALSPSYFHSHQVGEHHFLKARR